jgi:nicotinamidase-related amidase
MVGVPQEPMTDAVADHTMDFELHRQSTALVIVDMQYASANRTTGFGAWLNMNGRAAEGDYRFSRIESVVVPHIQTLLSAFRGHGLHRIFVRLGSHSADCRDLLPHLRELEAAFGNVKGRREFEILDELKPEPGEPVLTKTSASAFTSSGIDALLRNLRVDTVVFVGVSTSQCVDLTARDAADRGYLSLIVEDAVAEDTEEFHRATLDQFGRLFGRVASTADVLSELGMASADAPR